jgi:hypothetical protein
MVWLLSHIRNDHILKNVNTTVCTNVFVKKKKKQKKQSELQFHGTSTGVHITVGLQPLRIWIPLASPRFKSFDK